MFDPYAHEVDPCKQGELDLSLLNNNKLSMWTHSLLQCIVHVPEQTQIDRQEFWCRNPSFGLMTKAKGIARVRAKRKLGS
jgi:hypothetical protein